MRESDSRDHDEDELIKLQDEITSIRSRIQNLHTRAGERAPVLQGLREETNELKGEIQRRKQESYPENFFTRCCGVIVDQGNAITLSIRFTPMYLGRKWEVYNLILRRNTEKQWIFSYCDLPYSIKFIPDTIFKARIFKKTDLCNFIRKIQRQVQAHVIRREMFVAAEDLLKEDRVKLYSAFNTLHTTVQMIVADADNYEDYTVYVHLQYTPDTILPKEMSFKFDGGSEESHSEFKKTMSLLKNTPLPDALKQLFCNQSQENISVLSEEEKEDVASKKKVIAKTPYKNHSEDSDNSFKSASTLPVHFEFAQRPIPPHKKGSISQDKQLNNSPKDISQPGPKRRTRRPGPRPKPNAV